MRITQDGGLVMDAATTRPQGATKGSIRKSVAYTTRTYWQDRKAIVLIAALAVPLRVALPYIGILLPKLTIDLLTTGATAERFALTLGGMALLMALVSFAKRYSDAIVNDSVGTFGIFRQLLNTMRKRMTMDYALMLDPGFKEAEDKLDRAMSSNHAPAMNIPRTMVELLSSAGGLLLYAGVIASVHPLILGLLAVSAGSNWLALSRARAYMEKTREARGKAHRRIETLRKALQNPAAAKDMRLYGALGWVYGWASGQFAQWRDSEGKVAGKQMAAQMIDGALVLLRDGIAYAFLLSLLLTDRMTPGDFVYVFSAIGALSGWIAGVLTGFSDLSKASVEMMDIIAVGEYPDRMRTGPGCRMPIGDALPPSLSLSGVSYTYPGAEKQALSDINLTIRQGERIAIVGANGAGKTTLIKVLTGLYQPTEGTVSLAGVPQPEYNRDEYYSLFSPVFQDIHLLSCDIAGNVSQQTPEDTDMARVWRCLEGAGLADKVKSLPKAEKTLLVRSVSAEAIELSGGEKQKLAMARALYKDAPVLVLDEPTAALDPIAENETYLKYAELTEGKTSVYISHRLASTRFCDRILLLDGNTLTEQGTHDELMRLGGTYAHMFQVQASYYQEEQRAGEGEAVHA